MNLQEAIQYMKICTIFVYVKALTTVWQTHVELKLNLTQSNKVESEMPRRFKEARVVNLLGSSYPAWSSHDRSTAQCPPHSLTSILLATLFSLILSLFLSLLCQTVEAGRNNLPNNKDYNGFLPAIEQAKEKENSKYIFYFVCSQPEH